MTGDLLGDANNRVNGMLFTGAECVTRLISGKVPDNLGKEGPALYGKTGPGPLGYFHYVFAALSMSQDDVIKIVKDVKYANFLLSFNGCVLYDKVLSIYGISGELVRGVRPIDQHPIDFERQNMEFSLLHPDLLLQGTRIVGFLDLNEPYKIVINTKGETSILKDEVAKILFIDFDEFLCSITKTLSDFLEFPKPIEDDKINELSSFIFANL